MANILVVDDVEDITDTVRILLENEGHDVDIVNNSTDAKSQIRNRHYDIMITDVLMPEESGISLIDDIYKMADEQQKPTKIIVMSGGGPTMESNIALGAASFKADFQMKKPFTKDKLIHAINAMLAMQDTEKTGT